MCQRTSIERSTRQILQGLAYSAGTWVSLTLAQVGGAGLPASAAGAVLLIPVIGTVLAVVPPLPAVLTWNPDATLPVLVALVALQQLVLNGLGPRIMGRELGLPPLLVLAGVLVGATVSGSGGPILGVPVLSVAFKLVAHFRPTNPTSARATAGESQRRSTSASAKDLPKAARSCPASAKRRRGTSAAGVGEALSEPERTVASLVTRGYTNREIAEQLVIRRAGSNLKTTDTHIHHVLHKLGLSNRVHITTWGMRPA